MKLSTTTIFSFLNIILAALLAGTSFGILVGFNPSQFSYSTYVEQQQHLLRSLNSLMVTLVIMATFITIISAYLQRKNRAVYITLIMAAIFFIACIIISRFGNQPLQTTMLQWDKSNVPSDWMIFRDKWWMLHTWRTIAELLALALITWVSIIKGNHSSSSKQKDVKHTLI
jgi:uncharacterized membrane protein